MRVLDEMHWILGFRWHRIIHTRNDVSWKKCLHRLGQPEESKAYSIWLDSVHDVCGLRFHPGNRRRKKPSLPISSPPRPRSFGTWTTSDSRVASTWTYIPCWIAETYEGAEHTIAGPLQPSREPSKSHISFNADWAKQPNNWINYHWLSQCAVITLCCCWNFPQSSTTTSV